MNLVCLLSTSLFEQKSLFDDFRRDLWDQFDPIFKGLVIFVIYFVWPSIL